MTNFDAQFWSISQIENLNKSLFEDTTKDTKQHLATWQKRFAVSSKILEISEGYENFTDDEKTRAVEELKFLFNTTHPNSFMPEVKSALSKNYADIRNRNEISDGQYWDKVREYGYGTVAIGLTLTTLSPVAIALVGMGLLTTAAMDDVLIDDPDYETADTILKAVYFNALVQSHESLTKIPRLQSQLSAQIQGQELDIGSVGKGAESIKSPKLKKLAEKIEEAKNNKNGATEVLTSDQLKDAMNTKELSAALAAELKRLEEKREKEHQKAKEEEIKRRRERGERRAAVHLISVTLDKVFDDPEAASFVSASFEAYEKIDKAISLFSASPPAIGPAALTSTLVSVALEVTGIFKKAGPSPEQVILESLQAVHQSLGEIKKMIRDLATHLDKRLDDISKRQAKILNVLISGIDDIIQSQEVGFSELQASITRLQVNLRLFQEKVADDRIRQERTKLHAELQKLSTISTKAENLNEEDIRETERALEFFLNYATPPYNWLTNPLLAGTQLSSWDDRAVQQLVSSSNRDDVFSALSLAHCPSSGYLEQIAA